MRTIAAGLTVSSVLALTLVLTSCRGGAGDTRSSGEPFPPDAELVLVPVDSISGEEDELLIASMRRLALDPGGRLLIADGGYQANQVIWVVDLETKALVKRVGGEGEGPGEFGTLTAMMLGPGDSLYTYDARQRRVSVFTPQTYEYERSLTIEGYADWGPSALLSVSDHGLLVQFSRHATPETINDDQFVELVVVSSSGEPDTTLKAVFPFESWVGKVTSSGRGMAFSAVPFAPAQIFAVGSDGFVYTGWSEALDIEVRSPDRETTSRITYDVPKIAIPPAVRDSILQAHTDDAEMRGLLREAMQESKPAFSSILVDDRDRAWVRLNAEEEADFYLTLVFERDGTPVGHVSLPSNTRLMLIRGDRAYAVRSGELGEREVVVYEVKMPVG